MAGCVQGTGRVAGVDRAGQIARAYGCLYGARSANQAAVRRGQAGVDYDVPGKVVAARMVELFASATLVFLSLLAVRNRYRIG